MDGEEPTQATQNVLDPRRVGQQNSGFSDEDISDIICVLYPHSESARQEVQRLAAEGSPLIIGKDAADGVEPDYALEDHVSNFDVHQPASNANHAIILRLSAPVKSPAAGFAFGRNAARCDVVFVNDPLRRVSNIHFRIYVNEFGAVMIEDQSTNGTSVDRMLLNGRGVTSDGAPKPCRWVLDSGSLIKVLLHNEARDLSFRVRIPRRDDQYAHAYEARVAEFFERHGLPTGGDEPAPMDVTAKPNEGGTVDLFKAPGAPRTRAAGFEAVANSPRPPSKRQDAAQISRSEWTGSGKYNRGAMIGKGAFAVVYKVTAKYDGRPYAAKELEKRRFIKNGVLDQKVENEMKIMQRVQHPNIVRYMENFDWDDRLLIIIMEYVPGGDLGKLVADNGPVAEGKVRDMSMQLLSALGYLHANNITHRDVKPDNILIQSVNPFVVKLTDFGLSKVVDTAETFLRTFCGTLLYCAPEVYTEYSEYDDHGVRNRGKRMRRIPGQRYNHAVDLWSLGGVLFYTLTGSPPYPAQSGISYSELLHKIMTTNLDICPLEKFNVSDQGIDFLEGMLQRRPEQRATVQDLENHAWLGGYTETVLASQQYEEMTDDEMEPSQIRPPVPDFEDDRISDSMSDISDKENNNSGEVPDQQPRLFGEVGASAIGSSGVIPADFLNLASQSADSMGATEILEPPEDEAYDSGDSSTMAGRNRLAYHLNATSIYPNQSDDQLQSLVENVASQSLGGEKKASFAQPFDPNTSKRKPPSHDTSEEYDENTPPAKHMMKRLKSEGNMEAADGVSDETLEEFKLLVGIPQNKSAFSKRLVDRPVSKSTWWSKDRETWHLRYPEMTQLQYDAFHEAATRRGESFEPGKTPLWDLAMKYFGPSPDSSKKSSRDGTTPGPLPDNVDDYPSTAPPGGTQDIPDTWNPGAKIVVPLPDDMSAGGRAVAMIDTHPESCVDGISFIITDGFASFGRGPENTNVFREIQEPRVPKYAFKLLLWKDGQELSRNGSRHPWARQESPDDARYHFWISTKATLGIRINGYQLASSEPRNPSAPSQYWAKLYHGDSITIWNGGQDQQQTKLTFRCFWGGSSAARPADRPQLEIAPVGTLSKKLDAACEKAVSRRREDSETRRQKDDLRINQEDRMRSADAERERSHQFEQKRQEAIDFFAARPDPSRRASASPAGFGHHARRSPDKIVVSR